MPSAAATPTVDPPREEAELRAYLGSAYDRSLLERYQQTLEDELVEIGDEQTLYRTSEAYLYNLTAFAMTGTKLPYLADLTRLVPPPARILDYGCGIGSDGLALLEAGYRVAFADFDNPSTRYLRWRLEQRGLEAPVHDLDRGEVPAGFDAAFAFDVIEHVDDPLGFLGELESRARLVAVNFLEQALGLTKAQRAIVACPVILLGVFLPRAVERAIARTEAGGWILLKASRGMRLERVLDAMKEQTL